MDISGNDVEVMGGNFNYLIASGIYYAQIPVWIFSNAFFIVVFAVLS